MYQLWVVLFFDVVDFVVYFYGVVGDLLCIVVGVEFDQWGEDLYVFLCFDFVVIGVWQQCGDLYEY